MQTNAIVPVEMDVTRYRMFPAERMVQLWGYVGDYEVCVHLPLDDPRVQALLGECGGSRDPSPPESR